MGKSVAAISAIFFLVFAVLSFSAFGGPLEDKLFAAIDARYSEDGDGEDNLDDIAKLFDDGAKVSARNPEGGTPLSLAVDAGDVALVELLLQKKADVNLADKQGDSALLMASQRGNLEIIEILVQNGADVSVRNKEGYSSLFLAAQQGNLEAVTILLDKGADPNSRGPVDVTPLMATTDPDIVKALIDKGADVNARSATGMTPLMYACLTLGNSVVAATLLEKGADPNAKADNGVSASVLAGLIGDKKTMALLNKPGGKK